MSEAALRQETITNELRAYWQSNPAKVGAHGLAFGSAAYYDAVYRHHVTSFQAADALLDWASLANLKVLDMYCGIGVDAVTAARRGAEAVALATAPAHAVLTRGFAERQGIEVQIVVADPDRLPFADESFDFVFARGILMFTPAVERAVGELYRIQRPEGRFMAMVLNRWSWFPALARLGGTPLVQEPRDPPYIRLDSARRARRLFAGCRELQVVPTRLPRRTTRSGGLSVLIFNHVVAPLFAMLPRWLVGPLGYYLIVTGRRPPVVDGRRGAGASARPSPAAPRPGGADG